MSACCGTDDARLPEPLLAELRRGSLSLVVGDNEPYSARDPLRIHAQCPRAAPASCRYCSLEVRQDLIDTSDTAKAWGHRLAPAIREAVAKALA